MKFGCVTFTVCGSALLMLVILTVRLLEPSPVTKTSSVAYESIKSTKNLSQNAIHLAVIISGARSCNQALTMFKSVLLSMGRWDRNACPGDQYTNELITDRDLTSLIFHVIIDDQTYRILWPTLLRWYPEWVTFHFYNLKKYSERIRDLKNSHHAGSSTMVKLVVTQIVPAELEKIIFLDSDLLFLSNVKELWKHFGKFEEEEVFGMVQEQNPYYRLTLGRLYWPELDYGYNAGLMLVHLARLRRLQWDTMWRRNSEALRSAWNRLPTGEQDIYNTVFQSNPELIHELPCNWNYQLSPVASDKRCAVMWPSAHVSATMSTPVTGNLSMDIKVAHFNAALKPEDTYPKPWKFPDPLQNGMLLTRVQVAHRFLVMYYSLRNMSLNCFR